MRRILASLFVIGAVIGVGVFATGAYFTDTVTQDNITFHTGSASLSFGFCDAAVTPGDCATAPTPHHYLDFAALTAAPIGPGITNDDCLVIENTGDFALDLTGGISTYTQSVGGMNGFFYVKAETVNQFCTPGSGTVIFGSQSLANAYAAGAQSFGSLAPGGRLYVIWSNSWDSTGNQNALQGQTITVDTYMTGQTL